MYYQNKIRFYITIILFYSIQFSILGHIERKLNIYVENVLRFKQQKCTSYRSMWELICEQNWNNSELIILLLPALFAISQSVIYKYVSKLLLLNYIKNAKNTLSRATKRNYKMYKITFAIDIVYVLIHLIFTVTDLLYIQLRI